MSSEQLGLRLTKEDVAKMEAVKKSLSNYDLSKNDATIIASSFFVTKENLVSGQKLVGELHKIQKKYSEKNPQYALCRSQMVRVNQTSKLQ